jgi:hypothetical protein
MVRQDLKSGTDRVSIDFFAFLRLRWFDPCWTYLEEIFKFAYALIAQSKVTRSLLSISGTSQRPHIKGLDTIGNRSGGE